MRAWLVVALVLMSAAARAQAPVSVRYELETKQVVQGEPFEFDVVVTTTGDAQLDELSLPDLSAFTVLRESRASATQVQLRGGKRLVTTEQRFVFVLRAMEAGKLTIGETNARVGKAIARAAATDIEVIASDEPPASARPAPGAPVVDRFGNNPPPTFLEITLDKTQAFVGEQVTGTTELYTQQPLSQWPRVPGLKPQGFLCVSLLGDERPAPTQRTVAGRPYYVYLLNRDALFPLSAGELKVPPMQIDVVAAGSMFSRGRPLAAKSEARTVTVRPLPDEGRPARFASGNVGAFSFEVIAMPESVPLGQPVTLTVAATGRGLLDRIELPTWDGGEVARVFPPTKKITRAQSDELVAGRVSQEMLVQAHKEGALTIPSLSLWVFDPDAGGGAGAYVELKSKPLQVSVRAKSGKASATGPSAGGSHQLVARGARPLKARVSADAGGASGELPVAFGVLALVGGAATFTVRRMRDRARGTVRGQRALAQQERARRLDEAATRGDLAALEQVLLDVLAARCGAQVKSTTTSALADVLVAGGLDAEQARAAVDAVRDIEASRYAPGGASERAKLVERVRALVTRLEQVEGAA